MTQCKKPYCSRCCLICPMMHICFIYRHTITSHQKTGLIYIVLPIRIRVCRVFLESYSAVEWPEYANMMYVCPNGCGKEREDSIRA
jgi:hypothetical protein